MLYCFLRLIEFNENLKVCDEMIISNLVFRQLKSRKHNCIKQKKKKQTISMTKNIEA